MFQSPFARISGEARCSCQSCGNFGSMRITGVPIDTAGLLKPTFHANWPEQFAMIDVHRTARFSSRSDIQ